MSSPKWLIAILMVFVMLQLVNGVLEYTYLPGDSTGDTIFGSLFSMSPKTPFAMWQAFTWDYAQFQQYMPDGSYNSWYILKYILFYPLSAGVAVLFLIAVLNLLSRALGGLFGMFGRS